MKDRKRPNGGGSIDCVRGWWRVRVMLDGKRTQLGPLHRTRERAEAALAAYHLERDAFETPAEITLRTFGATWLEYRAQHGSRHRTEVKTIDTERCVWGLHVEPSELASKPVGLITRKDVERFTHVLRATKARRFLRGERVETDRPLSRSSQRHVMRLVRQCFEFAIREELIQRSPAEGETIAPGGPRPRDLSDDWLREREIAALLSCEALGLSDRVAFATAIGTALRKDDLRLLEVGRVELSGEVGPGIRVWVSKSNRWHRIPVMPWLVPILAAHLAALPEGARFVFSPDADHQTPYAPGHSFRWPGKPTRKGYERSALERAGVARRVRFHDLRGTTATHLALGTWGRGWGLHEIQAMLAHSDQRVTERYVRRAEHMLAEAAAATLGGPEWSGRPFLIGVTPTPPGGIEPPTVRLEGPLTSEAGARDTASRGQRVADVAARLAAEVEAGEVSAAARAAVLELARELPIVAAAFALASAPDGEHAVRATIALLGELAAMEQQGSVARRA